MELALHSLIFFVRLSHFNVRYKIPNIRPKNTE